MGLGGAGPVPGGTKHAGRRAARATAARSAAHALLAGGLSLLAGNPSPLPPLTALHTYPITAYLLHVNVHECGLCHQCMGRGVGGGLRSLAVGKKAQQAGECMCSTHAQRPHAGFGLLRAAGHTPNGQRIGGELVTYSSNSKGTWVAV